MPTLELTLPPSYTEKELYDAVAKMSGISRPYYRILTKSLDARKRSFVHYYLRVAVDSRPLEPNEPFAVPVVSSPVDVVVAGFGPAGYFAALVLSLAGCRVTVLEQGKDVEKRSKDIDLLDTEGIINPASNYLFGEGGAGTFSDGKLTSRTKSIKKEREFIYTSYIESGAPLEIACLSKPHIGSDKLREMMPRLRKKLEDAGGTIHFETRCAGFKTGQRLLVETTSGSFDTDYLIFAPGHSSYDTYRMMMKGGVRFRPKPGAIGVRVEHPQSLINRAIWGREHIAGLTSAEYALTWKQNEKRVYSFCMCPGGMLVPAVRTQQHSGINGASLYARDKEYANAAIVSAFSLEKELGRELDACEVLDYFERYQHALFERGGLRMSANRISEFMKNKVYGGSIHSSYPAGVYPDSFEGLLPKSVLETLREAFRDFTKRMKGFEEGMLVGTELTSSAPIQVHREKSGLADGFEKVYVCGEGSGYAGGIISSAADGIRCALDIIEKNQFF